MHSPAQIFEREVALERVGGDVDLLCEIAALFLREAPVLFDQLSKAVSVTDASAVEHLAHSLKGSAANFGARAVVACAKALEDAGRSREMTRAHELLKELQQSLAILERELTQLSSL